MAKIKLPFELERPSGNEWAVRSEAVGHGDKSVKDALNEIANDVGQVKERLENRLYVEGGKLIASGKAVSVNDNKLVIQNF